jgi:hypothetical protein
VVPFPQADQVVVKRPDGRSVTLTPRKGQPLIFEETNAIGLYEVSQRQGEQVLGTEQFAVNLADEVESNIRPSQQTVSSSGESLVQGALVTIQREIWVALALLALALLLGEWWLFHRRSA